MKKIINFEKGKARRFKWASTKPGEKDAILKYRLHKWNEKMRKLNERIKKHLDVLDKCPPDEDK